MSFIECLRGHVRPKSFKEIEEAYDGFIARGMDDAQAAAALSEWWKDYTVSFKQTRMMSAIKQAEVEKRIEAEFDRLKGEWDKMNPAMAKILSTMRIKREPTLVDAQIEILSQADQTARAEVNKLLGSLSEVYKLAAPKGLMLDADRRAMGEIVTGIIDGVDNIRDPAIKGAATQLRRAFDRGLEGLLAQGAKIGKLENYAPVQHNASKIGEAGFDAWFSAYSNAVKTNEVIDFRTGRIATKERFKEIAQDMFDDVTSNGATRVKRQVTKYGREMKASHNTDTFTRRMQGRIANFKNAESFHAYNRAFGVGDEGMFDLMVSTLDGIGHDIGIMKVLGPMPRAHVQRMVEHAKINSASAREVAKLEGMYRTLEGAWKGSVDDIFSKGVSGFQSLLSASLLGTASISALADTAFIHSTKRLHGLIGGTAFETVINTLAGNADDSLRALHIAEALAHVNVSRFDGSEGMSPTGSAFLTKLNGVKNANHRISGLQHITNATGDVLTMAFFGDIGMYAQRATPWAELPANFRSLLSRHGLNADDMAALAEHGVDERGFITPNGLPDEMSAIAERLDNINVELRMFATNSPELRTRYWSSGNVMGEQVRGGLGHLTMSSVMQFKSFPVQVWRNHFVPSMVKAAQGDVTPLGVLILYSTFMGTMVTQLKESLKGRPMYDYDDPDLYVKGLWQAGFAGLVGDAMFKDPDGYRRNLISELAGPTVNVSADLVLETMSNINAAFTAGEEVDTAGMTRAMKPFVPFSSLWYAKTAFDRIGMDSLNAALDDDYYETINRRRKALQKDRGGQGWWEQGELTPEVMQ